MNQLNDQRLCGDRRDREIGPPGGWRERRRTVERRLPVVVEVPFSDWLAQFRGYVSTQADRGLTVPTY